MYGQCTRSIFLTTLNFLITDVKFCVATSTEILAASSFQVIFAIQLSTWTVGTNQNGKFAIAFFFWERKLHEHENIQKSVVKTKICRFNKMGFPIDVVLIFPKKNSSIYDLKNGLGSLLLQY